MTTIKAIIFDKDGTLHDTEKVYMQAWKAAADEFGGIPDIEDTIRDCTGATIPWIAEYWAKKYPDIPFEDYLPRRQFYYFGILEQGVPVKEGAHEVLSYLKAHGYKIGMATSTPWNTVKDHLERTDMMEYFDTIVTGDMIEHGKPAPDIYLLAAERLGMDPADCIGVEDSISGVRAVCAAGMRAVMIPDMIQPTEEIEGMLWKKCEALTDIISILEEGI
ncbi:MAG: HAD family phosphatase [Ruminococcaceae bacterium]|nr:HAD family phosphatase [Oscillospiraceae bacterium]